VRAFLERKSMSSNDVLPNNDNDFTGSLIAMWVVQWGDISGNPLIRPVMHDATRYVVATSLQRRT